MGAVPIIKFLLTWIFGFALFIFMTPSIKQVLKHSGLYDLMPPEILAYGDALYFMWTTMIFVIPLVAIITSWREAEQRAREG